MQVAVLGSALFVWTCVEALLNEISLKPSPLPGLAAFFLVSVLEYSSACAEEAFGGRS